MAYSTVALVEFAAVAAGAVALHASHLPVELLVGPFVLPAVYLLGRRQLRSARGDHAFDAVAADDAPATRTGGSRDPSEQ